MIDWIISHPDKAITLGVVVACAVLLLVQFYDIRKNPEQWR